MPGLSYHDKIITRVCLEIAFRVRFWESFGVRFLCVHTLREELV